jgi:uncharacterized protein with HEPN domain
VKPDDAAYLSYAARSIDYILEDTSAGREHFLRDRQTRDAVLYRLHTLTQALRNLSDERRRRYPEVPFRGMSGFRNVIVHDFIGIKVDAVWNVVEIHLPRLKPQVERMLADLTSTGLILERRGRGLE